MQVFCKVTHWRSRRVCIKVFDWALCLGESRRNVTNAGRLEASLFNVTNGLIYSADYVLLMFLDILHPMVVSFICYFSSHKQMRILFD